LPLELQPHDLDVVSPDQGLQDNQVQHQQVQSHELVEALEQQNANGNRAQQVQPQASDEFAAQLNAMGNLDQDQQVEEGHINNNFQQVGLALLPETLDCDPGLSDLLLSSRKSLNNADGIRYWAKYFAPQGYSEEIEVPRCWNDFCTINLLHPERFDWVKSLLESQAWSLISKDSDQKTSFTFSSPKKCPSKAPIECINAPVDKVNTEVQNENGGSPAQNRVESTCPAGPLSIQHKGKLSKAPLSCSEVIGSSQQIMVTKHLPVRTSHVFVVMSNLPP
jgi:hypothetical protein